MCLFIVFDIILTFNIGVYMEGFIIEDRKQIAKAYLKKNFILDLIGFYGFFMNAILNDKLYLYFYLFQIF